MNGRSRFSVSTKIDQDNRYSLAYDYSIVPMTVIQVAYSTIDIEILVNGMPTKYLYQGFQSARSGNAVYSLDLRSGDNVYFIFDVANDAGIKTAINVNFAQVVPLPSSFVFLVSGLIGVGLLTQKRKVPFMQNHALT